MMNATQSKATETGSVTWSIRVDREGAAIVGISMRRSDGLPFEDEYMEYHLSDYMREWCRAQGIDAGKQCGLFYHNRTVFILLDA